MLSLPDIFLISRGGYTYKNSSYGMGYKKCYEGYTIIFQTNIIDQIKIMYLDTYFKFLFKK